MGTPFVSLVPRSKLDGYKIGLPHDQQPASVPQAFCDAMEVREAVFVREQKVPIEYEFDANDPRSYHWVSYASVHEVASPEQRDALGNVIKARRSVTKTVPIGTVRVVPFPHEAHPRDGGKYVDGKLTNPNEVAPPSAAEEEDAAAAAIATQNDLSSLPRRPSNLLTKWPLAADRPTTFHDGREPYIKIGRLAVTKDYRSHGISRVLLAEVFTWLRTHPDIFDAPVGQFSVEALASSTPADVPRWNGLVCVHAQEQVEGFWRRWGFERDTEMGRWWEEGIPHIGMFRRLELEPKPLVSR